MSMQEIDQRNIPAAEMEALIPKYIRLRECLRRDLGRLAPGARLPSVAAIRRGYGVSQSTFDRALGDLRREGIVRTHQGKGMFTTELAHTRRLGFIFGKNIFADDQVYSQLLLQGVQRQAREREHLLYYFFQDHGNADDEQTSPQLDLEVRAGRLDGLLASGGLGIHPDGWDRLARFGLPFVAFAHRGTLPNRVCLDWVEAIRLGTEALLAQGCRRLALWHRNPYYAREKDAVFTRTLADAGARTRPEWNVVAHGRAPVDAAAEELFHQRWSAWDEKPDGIVCGDDVMTRGLVRAATAEGLCLATDLRLASHANKGSACWGAAPVTRMEFDMAEVAAAMVARLDTLIDGNHPEPDLLLIEPYVVPANRGD